MERISKVMHKKFKLQPRSIMTLQLSRGLRKRTVLRIGTVMSVHQLIQRRKSWMRQCMNVRTRSKSLKVVLPDPLMCSNSVTLRTNYLARSDASTPMLVQQHYT